MFFVVKNLSMYSELIFGLDVGHKVLYEKAGRFGHNLFFMFYSEYFFVLSIFRLPLRAHWNVFCALNDFLMLFIEKIHRCAPKAWAQKMKYLTIGQGK